MRAIGGAAFDSTYALPAGAWQRLSRTPNRGYVFKDAKALHGPVKKVVLGSGAEYEARSIV